MDYEPGMQIIWDVITREVVVIFRGTATSLPGKFADRQAGIEAGELVCRNGGWGRVETPSSERHEFRSTGIALGRNPTKL